MTTIYYERDADPHALEGSRIAVVGYGNQGRSWALNLRDSGHDVSVHARADASRDQAEADGFVAADIAGAGNADVVCLLVPDDVIPGLALQPEPHAMVVVASGYTLAFGRLEPGCDAVMVAPRMLGPEVRRCYEEGVGYITLVGVHSDPTGTAKARMLALTRALGGLRQGAIEVTPMQEAILDIGTEQALAPALQRVNTAFVEVMLEQGIPLEAIMSEILLSGEFERTIRRVRLEGWAAQMEHHSPTSQYGQLSRRDRFDGLDVAAVMREIVGHVASGAFADEWDAERDAGYARLNELKATVAGPDMQAIEADIRSKVGELADG